MKEKLFLLTVLLLAMVFSAGSAEVQGQRNNDWFQRQQQQQRIMEQQRQQQMRDQQRREMIERQRREMQDQQRRVMQEQQRLRMQQQMRPGVRSGAGNVVPFRGAVNQRPGFTGRTTGDGRALAVINNRTFAVPRARVASNDNFRRTQTTRWTAAQRAAISTDVRKLAASGVKARASNGGRSGGGGGRSGGGDDGRTGGNGPRGPKKGDLTKTFNKAAGRKFKKGDVKKMFNEAAAAETEKESQEEPEPKPRPKPSPSPRPEGPKRRGPKFGGPKP